MACTQHGLYVQAAFNPGEGQDLWRTNKSCYMTIIVIMLKCGYRRRESSGKRYRTESFSQREKFPETQLREEMTDNMTRKVSGGQGGGGSTRPDRARWVPFSIQLSHRVHCVHCGDHINTRLQSHCSMFDWINGSVTQRTRADRREFGIYNISHTLFLPGFRDMAKKKPSPGTKFA